MPEQITPEDFERATFSTSLRGYDRSEVDSFLQTAAESIRAALKETSEKAYLNLGEQIGSLLQHAKDSADEIVSEARSEAEAIRSAAQDEASQTREEAKEHAAREKKEAESTARRTREAAENDASRRTSEASEIVTRLQAAEADVRERLRELRIQTSALTDRLQQLESAEPIEAEAEAQPEELVQQRTEEVLDQQA